MIKTPPPHPPIEEFGFSELEIGKVYSKWIYSVIKPFVGKQILEIGSGLGGMIGYYPPASAIIASDINSNYLTIIKNTYKGRKNLVVKDIDIESISKASTKELRCQNIDTVIAINVLEHIKDDSKALRNIYNLLAHNGRLILFVPALPRIYGSLDEAFGHYRRYYRKDVIAKTQRAGFTVEYWRYFNIIGICWWFIVGKILKKKNLPVFTGKSLQLIVPLLQRIESHSCLPIGQSVILVVKK